MNLILILVIIVCVLLTFIVLIQNPKGGGIASNFSAGNQIMGVKKTNDFIEKGTWTLAAVLTLLVLFSNFFTGGNTDNNKSVIQDQIEEGGLQENYVAPNKLPNAPAQEQNDAPADNGIAVPESGQD